MFISSKEKLSLTLRITVLEGRVEQLSRSLNAVLDAKTTVSFDARPKRNATTEEERARRYEEWCYYKKKMEASKASAKSININ